MFDIDGTLVDSTGLDEECYIKAAHKVLGINIPSNWNEYTHATDAGILNDIIIKYNIQGDTKSIHSKFKHVYTKYISNYINNNPDTVNQITGAGNLIKRLRQDKDIAVAIATGGWEETAKLKLNAAEIDIKGIAFASSNDHYKRTEIMKIAANRATTEIPFISKIYFGDALWDKHASSELNYTFIAIGNNTDHEIQIRNYQQIESVLDILEICNNKE